jgi:alkanesulfonate monooxygenase
MDLVADDATLTLQPTRGAALEPPVDLFSACPVSIEFPAARSYAERIRDVAVWGEKHGCRGALVYCDNRLVDPWLVSQIVVQSTRAYSPLIAVQPVYMHPFTVANLIATFAMVHGRRLFINWVAGGFVNDLAALADQTPHDERYDRVVEYATIVRRLTDGESVTFNGKYYRVHGLKLRIPMDASLRPDFVISGSSPAGRTAAAALGARSVSYALSPEEEQAPPSPAGLAAGLRVGVIARASSEEAWRTAYTRFPPDRKGVLMRQLARKVSDSHWHERLCRLAEHRAGTGTPYWTLPFENYRTMCPYLVGDHTEVSAVIAEYIRRGFGTFILDEPETETDLENARLVFDLARQRVAEAA